MTDDSTKPKPKGRRRWLRYSLRSMLLVVLALSVWLAWMENRAATQRRAVKTIRRGGGNVHYDFEYESKYRFNTARQPLGPEWMHRWFGIDYFGNVTTVFLSAHESPDKAIDSIGDLPRLEMLKMGGSAVDDDHLAELVGLSRLEWLDLSGTNITDASMESIASFPSLETLGIRRTKITDRSVPTLAKLQRLKRLFLTGNSFSPAAIERLQRALPECEIEIR